MSIDITRNFINTTRYEFSSDEYFGNGIVISNNCDYSFRYLSQDLPLIKCYDNYLELNRYKKRGIYTLDIHTCIIDGADMTVKNMKDNVYAVWYIYISWYIINVQFMYIMYTYIGYDG